jgi:hypothetical protein
VKGREVAMERGFCAFTESPSGTQIVVNVSLVRYVRPDQHGTSTIYFDDQMNLLVQGDVKQVLQMMRNAFN